MTYVALYGYSRSMPLTLHYRRPNLPKILVIGMTATRANHGLAQTDKTNLRNLVYYSLDNDLLQNALFHAGRLHGLEPRSGDAAHLIALCHFRMGQYKASYDYSRERGFRGSHLGCAYIFAQACLMLQKYVEGANALERCKSLWTGRNHWSA